MRRALISTLIAVALLLIAIGCSSSSSGDVTSAEAQRKFGVRMARMNLWREAMFRFRRAVEIDPDNAMAHNNLAVALEATGDLEGAAREYREALRLDRSNQYIQRNYSRYVEFMQRGKKREAKPATATTTGGAADSQPAESTTAEPVVAPPTTTAEAAVAPPETPPPATTTTNPPDGGLR
jgi:Tfp pilus assembly protein PilF